MMDAIGLERSYLFNGYGNVHVSYPRDRERLRTVIMERGFRIYILEGIRVENAQTFYKAITQAFSSFDLNEHIVTDHFASILSNRPERSVALFWEDVDTLLSNDLQVFVDAVTYLDKAAEELTYPETYGGPIGFEIFLLRSSDPKE